MGLVMREVGAAATIGMVLLSLAGSQAAGASGLQLGPPIILHSPFWFFLEVDADRPGTVTIEAKWSWKPPSGDPALTEGGYDVYQDHLRIMGRGVSSYFYVARGGCGPAATLMAGLPGLRLSADVEPPLCQLTTNTTSGSLVYSMPVAGRHAILIAQGGDFLDKVEFRATLSEGLSAVAVHAGHESYFRPVENFEKGVGSAVEPLPSARAAIRATANVGVDKRLTGIFFFEAQGASVGTLTVDGPEHHEGGTRYVFRSAPPGDWTFGAPQNVAAGVASFLYLFVVDSQF